MTSLMTTSLILFSCWVMIAKCRAGDTILDFFAIFNGNCSNFDEYKKGEGLTDVKLEVWLKPVSVPTLQNEPMIYVEEAVNGSVYRMWVVKVTASSNGDIIYLTPLNFTDPSQHKPGTFNTDDLAKLPRKAFQGQPDCVAAVKKVYPEVFTGAWPDCRHEVNKIHPEYSFTVTCDRIYETFSVESFENVQKTQVVFIFKRPKYPVIGAPEGYVSPCKDGQ